MTDSVKARIVVSSLEMFQRLQEGMAIAGRIEDARLARRGSAAEVDELIAWASECRRMVEFRGLTGT